MRIEPKRIIHTLLANNDQVRQIARIVGISPSTVNYWKHRAANGNLIAIHLRYATKKYYGVIVAIAKEVEMTKQYMGMSLTYKL